LLKSCQAWGVTVSLGLTAVVLWHLASRPLLDSQSRAVLAGATKVEVFRTDGMNGLYDSKPGETRIGGFLVTARGKNQGKEFAAKLADILFARETYSMTYNNCFWPGVVFRVWKGEESVDVLICFKCWNFYCGPPTNDAMESASFYRTPARTRLIRLAQEAFPDDKEIQKLKDDDE
jgi:hypothetical protein